MFPVCRIFRFILLSYRGWKNYYQDLHFFVDHRDNNLKRFGAFDRTPCVVSRAPSVIDSYKFRRFMLIAGSTVKELVPSSVIITFLIMLNHRRARF